MATMQCIHRQAFARVRTYTNTDFENKMSNSMYMVVYKLKTN